MPSNICLCVNPVEEYAVVCDSENHSYFLVMKHQIEFLSKLMNKTFTVVVDGMDGVTLQGSTYSHPLFHTYVDCKGVIVV